MTLVGLGDVELAREQLEGVVHRTPLVTSRVLSQRCSTSAYLKCENLQRTGSFKIRGAYVRVRRLSDGERQRGIVAASAGNHAQGVALAAQLLDVPATVYMPTRAPLPKLAATESYGATVRAVDDTLAGTLAAAERFASDTGAVFIHPFDHADVIAGQATVGLEIAEQLPDVGTVLVPTGGGGLLAGAAVALRALRPDTRIIGVQAERAAAWPGSLRAGSPRATQTLATMADGIAVGEPGRITFDHVCGLVDDVITVSEETLSQAMLLCLERSKLLVEPAGVATVAAILDQVDAAERFTGPVCAVLSGGNIDPLLLMHVTEHGLSAGGRFLTLRLTMSDRPGELAKLLARVGQLGANVLDVTHSRVGGALAFGEVEVALSLETRGRQHCSTLVDELRAGGYHLADNP